MIRTYFYTDKMIQSEAITVKISNRLSTPRTIDWTCWIMFSPFLFCLNARKKPSLNIQIKNHKYTRCSGSNLGYLRIIKMSTKANEELSNKPPVKDLTTATKLLTLMKEKNLDEFVATLHNSIFNIDHYYEAPENGTLLEIACRSYGYGDFVKVLIVYGAGGIINSPINQAENSNSDSSDCDNEIKTTAVCEGPGKQQTYLQYACKMGFIDVVQELLEMGFNPNESFPNSNDTPIKIAARNGHHGIVSILMNRPEISLEWCDSIRPVLESILDHIFGLENVSSIETDMVEQERDYYKCLEYILKRILRVPVNTKMPKPKRKLKSNLQLKVETES